MSSLTTDLAVYAKIFFFFYLTFDLNPHALTHWLTHPDNARSSAVSTKSSRVISVLCKSFG